MTARRYDYDLADLPKVGALGGVESSVVGRRDGGLLAGVSPSRQLRSSLIRQMPTSCQQLEVEINRNEVVLTGYVRTFYAKQMLYHLCRQLANDLEVVDRLVVDAAQAAYQWPE